MSASPNFPSLPTTWTETNHSLRQGSIYVRIYHSKEAKPPGERKGRWLFIVHGQAEQSDRYEHFCHYLNGTVEAIACIDLQGHGKSVGTRGHIESYDQYSEVCIEAFNYSKAWLEKLFASEMDAHWFGHSMGGLITLRTHIKNPDIAVKSVIASAPFLDFAFELPKIKTFLAKLVEPILGGLKSPSGLNASDVSRDPTVAAEYVKNPLNHKYVTPRWLVQTIKEHKFLASTKGPFTHNLLMIVPLGDKIVNPAASYRFFKNIEMPSGKLKMLTALPGYYHESFNDLGKERAFNALLNWFH